MTHEQLAKYRAMVDKPWQDQLTNAYAEGRADEREAIWGSHAKWRPIETAPKDAKAAILLGYLPLPRMAGAPRVYEGRWNDIQNDWTSLNGFLLHTSATHWMPMPAPPEA